MVTTAPTIREVHEPPPVELPELPVPDGDMAPVEVSDGVVWIPIDRWWGVVDYVSALEHWPPQIAPLIEDRDGQWRLRIVHLLEAADRRAERERLEMLSAPASSWDPWDYLAVVGVGAACAAAGGLVVGAAILLR